MKNGYDQFFKKAKESRPRGERVQVPKASQDIKSRVQSAKRSLIEKQRARTKKAFPLSAAAFLSVSLIVGIYLSFNLEKVEALFDSLEVQAIGLASAASETPAEKSSSKGQEEAKTAGSPDGSAEKKGGTPLSFTAEELAVFQHLEERRTALDQREAELKKLEEELQAQKAEMDNRLKEVETIRAQIASQLEEKVNVDKERVEQLVAFYSTMKPQQAAKIIETLNEDLAVEVLVKMKKKSAAEILNLIKADKAQRLSERFAGYRN